MVLMVLIVLPLLLLLLLSQHVLPRLPFLLRWLRV
jgi:hypothetical protein